MSNPARISGVFIEVFCDAFANGFHRVIGDVVRDEVPQGSRVFHPVGARRSRDVARFTQPLSEEGDHDLAHGFPLQGAAGFDLAIEIIGEIERGFH